VQCSAWVSKKAHRKAQSPQIVGVGFSDQIAVVAGYVATDVKVERTEENQPAESHGNNDKTRP